jgi:hypothetical protein
MWTKVFAAVLLAVVMLVAFSATRDTAIREGLLPNPSPAEAALDRVLSEVRIVDVPFEQAIERLKAVAQAEISVDWERLDPRWGGGFDRKASVRLEARGITLSAALTRLLAQRWDGIAFAPCGTEVVISTATALSFNDIVRCYPVRDLVPRDPTPWGGGSFGSPGPNPAPPSVEQIKGAELVELVKEVVAPQAWKSAGAFAGEARYIAGYLVIVQTWENHRRIQDLLTGLRQTVPQSSPRPGSEWLLWNGRQQQWLPASTDAARSALQVVLPEVRIENASLDDAVHALATLARTNIVVDGRSLTEAELDRKHLQDAGADVGQRRRLTLHLHDVTLRRALEAVLLQYSDSVWTGGFTVDEGVIVVTSDGRALHRTVTRGYDLRGWPEFDAARLQRLEPPEEEAGTLRAEVYQDLVATIEENVMPETWRDNGGVGQIRIFNDRMLISQTWQTQEKVRQFLNLMRANRPAPASPPAAPPPPARDSK